MKRILETIAAVTTSFCTMGLVFAGLAAPAHANANFNVTTAVDWTMTHTNPGVIIDGQAVGAGETLTLEEYELVNGKVRYFSEGRLFLMECDNGQDEADIRVDVELDGRTWIYCW